MPAAHLRPLSINAVPHLALPDSQFNILQTASRCKRHLFCDREATIVLPCKRLTIVQKGMEKHTHSQKKWSM